jgi:hypothetical protein
MGLVGVNLFEFIYAGLSGRTWARGRAAAGRNAAMAVVTDLRIVDSYRDQAKQHAGRSSTLDRAET